VVVVVVVPGCVSDSAGGGGLTFGGEQRDHRGRDPALP